MAGWKDFREIAAWQHSQRVKLRVYQLLERPKIRRDVKLSTQLRESARSAPGNIAEGFGRFGNKEFARFARISKGSLHESLNHLIDARDQRMITEDELLIEEHHIKKAIDAVTGLIRHLETTKGPKEPEPEPEPPSQNPTEPDPEDGTRNP
jgi:four helix bundle protein